MSTTPGASNEYSRGNEASGGALEAESGPAWRAERRRSQALSSRAGGVILAATLLAALLLVAAELTTLYQAHVSTKSAPIKTVTAGSHNSWAMIPIALLAAAFAVGVRRTGSRALLLGIGILGLVALLIALVHDLPDAHAVGLAQHNSVTATTTPGIGLYLETLGGILLIAIGGLGIALAGGPPRAAPARPERDA